VRAAGAGGAACQIAPGYSSAWAELALGLGAFGIGTGEFAIMGLLPDVARGVGVSVPVAGHLISAYALGVVVGSPIIAMLAARAPRRRLLVALAACFAVGNFASAGAPAYDSLLAWRFLCGMPHGAYLGVAALTAASLVPAAARTRAIGRMMLGLTGATLLGVPAATLVGQAFGWRACFTLVGSIGAISCLLILRWVPPAPVSTDASPRRELGALARRQVWLTLGVGSVGFAGLFAVVSYITPTLTELAGLAPRQVPLVLAVLGVGMILGNLVGSWLADRALTRTIGGLLIWNVTVLSLFSVVVRNAWAAVPTMLLIGSGVALVPALQARLMDVAGDAQTLAAALNHSAFNIANALGAWLGGLAVTAGFGWASTGWVGALLAVVGMLIFFSSLATGSEPAVSRHRGDGAAVARSRVK
jgi:DHA1 family inner membrane transport protein